MKIYCTENVMQYNTLNEHINKSASREVTIVVNLKYCIYLLIKLLYLNRCHQSV